MLGGEPEGGIAAADVAAGADPAPVQRATGRIRRRLAEEVSHLLTIGRYQLLGALILGVFVPTLVRWPSNSLWPEWSGLQFPEAGVQNGAVGCALAICAGFILLRQIKTHPGVNSIGYVLYAYAVAYLSVVIAFLFFRAEYARYQLLLSVVLVAAWFLYVQRHLARQRPLTYAITPYAEAVAFPWRKTITWRRLDYPGDDYSQYEAVITNFASDHSPEWQRSLTEASLAGRPIFDAMEVREQLTGKAEISHFSDARLGSTLHGLLYAKTKRLLDFVLAVVLLPGVILIIGLAAVAIKLDDGGPVFFKQRRMGYKGKPFTVTKLRSMKVGVAGPAFTTRDDARITRVGGVLRKYRIDELPQVLNVLAGEMSWIGPRPESVELAAQYEREISLYSLRHMVRPGISGWAQVNQGNVGLSEAAREKLYYDFYYIKNVSPWLDALIVAKTMSILAFGREYG